MKRIDGPSQHSSATPGPPSQHQSLPSLATLFDRATTLLPAYEVRPQQQAMSDAIHQALEEYRSLIVEAPTGVGKTLAYLLPAVLTAIAGNRRAIISTQTKNLQEQLVHHDLPLVASVMRTPFSSLVMKGRRNYLCTTRLEHALASARSLFTSAEQTELEAICEWGATTPDGDVENLGFVPSPHVWDMVASEGGTCNPHACRSGCFYQRLWERARAATLVVMNHALFFTLMGRQEDREKLIFGNEFVVFDEAHSLEGIASTCLGLRLSRSHVLNLLHRIHHPRTRKGLLGRKGRTLKRRLAEASGRTQEFFSDLARAASAGTPAGPAREYRVRRPNILHDEFTPYLLGIADDVGHAAQEGSLPFEEEITAIAEEIEATASALAGFLDQTTPDSAYWVETGPGRDPNVTACISPIDVGALLEARLFGGGTPCILTSATLSVGGSGDYFRKRIGARDVEFLQLDSPFSYASQMRLCIAAGMPEPDAPGYAPALADSLLQAIRRTEGRALVLFTSAANMRTTAEALAPALAAMEIRLLVQGAEQSRHVLLDHFRNDLHSVLFGLDSFWTGVDVPGDALGHVIIVRLPFAAPGHPLTESKLEAISRKGGNPFTDLSLPEAVLKFRQGVGRLIRNTDDRGIVTVLDSRLVRKAYGRIFLQSLPRCPLEYMNAHGEITEVTVEST